MKNEGRNINGTTARKMREQLGIETLALQPLDNRSLHAPLPLALKIWFETHYRPKR